MNLNLSEVTDKMNQHVKLFLRRHPTLYHLVARLYGLRALDRRFRKELHKTISELGVQDIRLIQIGANDAGVNNPFSKILRKGDINAVLIEPVPYVFAKLQRKFWDRKSVILMNCAITPNDMLDLNFYWVDPKAKVELGNLLPPWWDQLASFERSNITNHLDGILEPYIRTSKVPTISISQLLDRHPQTNYLALDCEGYDYQILISYNFSIKPKFILFEYKHIPQDKLEDLITHLKSFGYQTKLYRDDAIARLDDT